MVMVSFVAPPSVLPDISPSRGEIDSWRWHRQTIEVGASGCAQPISHLEGEMPGRAEGGNAPATDGVPHQ